MCPTLYVDKWKVEAIEEIEANKPSVKDVEDGFHIIEETGEEKYLGDIISTDGKNDKNITSRVKKDLGSLNKYSPSLRKYAMENSSLKLL